MWHRAIGLTIAACCASVAFGQTPAAENVDRVFHLTQNQTVRQINEIATTVRSVAGVQDVTSDDLQKTLTVSTTAYGMAIAEWIIHQLDVPAPNAQPQQFAPAGTRSDIVRVYYTHATTPQMLQELVTNIRSVADVQRIFVYNSLHAIVLRDGMAEVGLADWLIQKLDLPGQTAAPPEYPYTGFHGPEVARVFYLAHSQTPRDIQEMITTIRSIADMQRIFIYNAHRAVALRGPADRVALAQWLVSELDRPANEPSTSGAHQYELPAGPDNQVRIFYLNPADTVDRRQQIASEVRTTLHVGRLFVYNPLGALTVRGTVGQIATADRLLNELKEPGR
jgi:hypothetical protein